jgi:phenylalanyl-tRNA synthetase beta chain
MFNSLRYNLSQGNSRLRLFEVAQVFCQDATSDTMTKECNRLGVLLFGSRSPEHYPFAKGDVEYADIKGIVEHLGTSLGLAAFHFELQEEHPYLQPCVRVFIGETFLGHIGMLRPGLADDYNAHNPVWFADLDLGTILRLESEAQCSFNPIAKYPAVRRDTTIIAPKGMPFADISRTILARKEPLVEDVILVDVYEPEDNAEENHVTLRVTYRSMTKTLKDKEVDKVHTRIGQELLTHLGVRFS